MSEGKNESIGALWVNKEKKFLSGSITIDGKETKIIVFKNDRKSEDKHPDYRIFLSKPKGESAEREPF
jgi:uncharacterized protein (DUF736 family)